MRTRGLLNLLWLALAIALAFGMVACGDDDDDDDTSATDDDAADDDAADDDAADDDAADDDDDNDTTDDDDDDDNGNEIFNITFDDYTAGAQPPAPWTVNESVPNSVLVVADPTKKDGNVLEISGDVAAGNGAVVTYPFTTTLEILDVSFWMYNNGGAAFGFQIESESTDWLVQLVNNPTTYEVTAYDGSNATVCATIVPAGWYKMEVVISLTSGTYDIKINDAATACAGLTANVDTVIGASFLDFIDAGYGGIVYYDDFMAVEY